MQIHIVEPGQTLAQVADMYGVTEQTLRQDNGGLAVEPLIPGQNLIILEREVIHRVQNGETLWSIGQLYGITTRELYQNNPFLMGSDVIYPGQILTIAYRNTEKIPMSVNGYAYPNINQELLRQTASYLTYVAPFTYGFTPEGELLPLEDEELLVIAGSYGTGGLLHLSTLTESGNFSNVLASQVLGNEEARANLTANVLAEIERKGYDGLDIDFEFVFPEEAQLYASFVRQLREALNSAGYPVIVALVPKVSADQPGDFYQGHDYRAIGEAANFVLLMTYGYGLLAHRLKFLENQAFSD